MKKTENAIMVFGSNSHEIACKSLKSNLESMLKAMSNMNDNTWMYAYHLENIISTNSFIDDFKELQAFANYIGVSKATITQYCKAIAFARKHGFIDVTVYSTDKTGKEISKNYKIYNIPFSIGVAYLLSTLKSDDEHTEYDDFITYASVNNGLDENEIFTLSVKALKGLIKAYKDSLKETTADETTGDETTADETTGDETTADETTADEHVFKIRTKEEAITAIKVLMNAYNIALTDLDN